MRVEWTEHAKMQKDQIAGYICRRFGYKRKKVFAQEIDETIKMLMRNPNIGPIDPLFDDRPRTYRSVIINGLSKMVYFIDEETIYIAAFWDTRREPKKQAEQVK